MRLELAGGKVQRTVENRQQERIRVEIVREDGDPRAVRGDCETVRDLRIGGRSGPPPSKGVRTLLGLSTPSGVGAVGLPSDGCQDVLGPTTDHAALVAGPTTSVPGEPLLTGDVEMDPPFAGRKEAVGVAELRPDVAGVLHGNPRGLGRRRSLETGPHLLQEVTDPRRSRGDFVWGQAWITIPATSGLTPLRFWSPASRNSVWDRPGSPLGLGNPSRKTREISGSDRIAERACSTSGFLSPSTGTGAPGEGGAASPKAARAFHGGTSRGAEAPRASTTIVKLGISPQ